MEAPEAWVPAEATIPVVVIAQEGAVPEAIIVLVEVALVVVTEVRVAEVLQDLQVEVGLLEEVGLQAVAATNNYYF
ncbi:hypothetical protein DZC72_00755 [Maribacter algicola]|uniref:Uncharacterized protein n=1 Tax=Maribacter algicola TaxID=2498892 RepID=A0A426RJQ0_9FLAO|nr:hypothetical protein DZC72_00755 [Maribacter algicola]